MPVKISGDSASFTVPTQFIFGGADINACIAARLSYFSANPTLRTKNLRTVLKPATGTMAMCAWDGSAWVDQSSVITGPTGQTGVKGDTGATGPFGKSIIPKGTYSSGVSYSPLDLVTYLGESYVCTVSTLNNLPTNTAYWQISAEKGDTGISGLTWKGVYSASTSYVINDVVAYESAGTNTIYVCLSSCVGVLPTNTTKWDILPIKGARGDTGPVGPQGSVGPAGPANDGSVGDVKMTACALPPTGWLACNGALVERAAYAALFAAIGTSYGAGDGASTFALPNMKGRVPVGLDTAQTEFNTLGKAGGNKTHTLTISEMPNHAHNYNDTYGVQNLEGTFNNANACDETERWETTSYSGGGQAHNNLQPYVSVNFVIKY
jgi:microcystin-dependent protein